MDLKIEADKILQVVRNVENNERLQLTGVSRGYRIGKCIDLSKVTMLSIGEYYKVDHYDDDVRNCMCLMVDGLNLFGRVDGINTEWVSYGREFERMLRKTEPAIYVLLKEQEKSDDMMQ